MFKPSKPTKVNENLSIRVDPYISVELLDDNTIGIFNDGKVVLRMVSNKSVDKLISALNKLKNKM